MSSGTRRSTVRWLVVAAILVGATAHNLRTETIPSGAFFGGDTWEYQSMAVNFAHGHGLKIGAILPYADYAFDSDIHDGYLETFDRFVEIGAAGGEERFYRTPAYPFLLGLLYRVVGVRPDIAMLIQMLVVIAIGASLPLLGERLLGGRGFAAGIAAGAIFATSVSPSALSIMTETLISFSCCLILWAWVVAYERPGVPRGIVLGIAMAFGLLVKGSLIFIPPLLIGWCLIRAWRTGDVSYRFVWSVAMGLLVPIVAYSTFASLKAERLVLLSTQGEEMLLDSHNEKTLETGVWDPSWRNDPSHPYSRGRSSEPPISAPVLVMRFYLESPEHLPTMVFRKLAAASGARTLTDWLAVNGVAAIWFVFVAATTPAPWILRSIGAGSAVILCVVFDAAMAMTLGGAVLILVAGVTLNRESARELLRFWSDPSLAALAIVLLNFILVTVVFVADQRFLWPAYFASLLTGGYLLIRLGEELRRNRSRPPIDRVPAGDRH